MKLYLTYRTPHHLAVIWTATTAKYILFHGYNFLERHRSLFRLELDQAREYPGSIACLVSIFEISLFFSENSFYPQVEINVARSREISTALLNISIVLLGLILAMLLRLFTVADV